MPNPHNILHLDINGITVEKIPILNACDVERIANGLIAAYGLNIRNAWYEIYYYKTSSMNPVEDKKVVKLHAKAS